ncbi:MAG TPA: GFA family protein [Sphingomicrobium sp.]|nr:GFA family protein [Sphingomicrobium sp.]
MSETHRGGCFCGAVEIEARGEPIDMGYCHCRSCRSYSGAPVTAFTLWPADQVEVTRGAENLAAFNKAGFSNRRYCRRCGGHLLVEHPTLGLTDVHAATLPGLDFRPSVHLNYAETVLPMRDGLPKLKDFPAEAGGSGELLPE